MRRGCHNCLQQLPLVFHLLPISLRWLHLEHVLLHQPQQILREFDSLLPLSLVEDTILKSLQQHFHKPILPVGSADVEAILVSEKHGLLHPAGFVFLGDAVHLHQMVYEAALSLV